MKGRLDATCPRGDSRPAGAREHSHPELFGPEDFMASSSDTWLLNSEEAPAIREVPVRQK